VVVDSRESLLSRYTSIVRAKRNHRQVNRYDVTGNSEAQFVDRVGNVLVNKKGIRTLKPLQILEEDALATAYTRLIGEVRTDTPLSCALIQHVHHEIFGDLFEWAGRWRTVKISKPGAIWPPPDFLDEAMQGFEREVLQRYPVKALTTDAQFCGAVGHIQGEFLAIHPFREGNARTIKLVTDLLALQTARPPLRYDMTRAGQKAYIDAAKASLHRKDHQPMEGVIRLALKRASPDA
jgi:cell filamentation protein